MKNLFFTALLAVAAIGGALTANASGIYYDANNETVDCTGNSAFCSDLPQQTLWTQPGPSGSTVQSIDLDDTNKLQ